MFGWHGQTKSLTICRLYHAFSMLTIKGGEVRGEGGGGGNNVMCTLHEG